MSSFTCHRTFPIQRHCSGRNWTQDGWLNAYANSGGNQFLLSLQMCEGLCAIVAHITLTSHSHKIMSMRAHKHTQYMPSVLTFPHTRARWLLTLMRDFAPTNRTHAHTRNETITFNELLLWTLRYYYSLICDDNAIIKTSHSI